MAMSSWKGEHVTQAKAGNMDGNGWFPFSLNSEGTAAFAGDSKQHGQTA